MANQPARFQIDEAIYKPSKPIQYGKVISCFWDTDPRFSGRAFYVVRWKDGTEETRWELNLKSLEALAADHEKKAATHRANIEKAKVL